MKRRGHIIQTSQTHILADVVEDVRQIAQDRDEVSVRAVMSNLGEFSQTGLMLLPALLTATPLSGIPGLTALSGCLIALIAAQMLAGRRHLWLPDWILNRRIRSDNLRRALDKSAPAIRFVDRHTHERCHLFLRTPGRVLIVAICFLCGFLMPFMELVPFTGSLMGATVTLLAISLLARDGLYAIMGLSFLSVSVGAIHYVVSQGL